MILILALGIRQGLPPSLSPLFRGWGEIIAIRARRVLTIRAKLSSKAPWRWAAHATHHLESCFAQPGLGPDLHRCPGDGRCPHAVGELASSHFHRGRAFAELEMYRPLYHYSDVPEWGALLSSIRAYARSYPWVAIYPTLAFLSPSWVQSVRRRIAPHGGDRGLGITRLVNRYTLACTAGDRGIGWVRANTARWLLLPAGQPVRRPKSLRPRQALATPPWRAVVGTPGWSRGRLHCRQFEAAGLQRPASISHTSRTGNEPTRR